MADLKVTMHVEGLSQILENLRKLPRELQDKELQKAANAGVKPVLVVARGNAARLGEGMKTHNSTGLLRRSVQMFVGRKIENNRAAFVGIKRLSRSRIKAFKAATGLKSSSNKDDPFYWKFWEFGSSKTPRRQFVTSAYETMKHVALEVTKLELRVGIERVAKRLKTKVLRDFKQGRFG